MLNNGTTAVVCKELNRNFIGCDINPKAIEITNARLDALSKLEYNGLWLYVCCACAVSMFGTIA